MNSDSAVPIHWEDPLQLTVVRDDLQRKPGWSDIRQIALEFSPPSPQQEDGGEGSERASSREDTSIEERRECCCMAHALTASVREDGSGSDGSELHVLVFAISAGWPLPTRSFSDVVLAAETYMKSRRNEGSGHDSTTQSQVLAAFCDGRSIITPPSDMTTVHKEGDIPERRCSTTDERSLQSLTMGCSMLVTLPIFNDGKIGAVRILDSDEYRREFLHDFDRDEVADEDLFNPAVYPVSAKDHEELAAAEAFNLEMAELEDLEHQEELRSLLQERITAMQHGASTSRPAKITSINSGVFYAGRSRGAPSWSRKGKRAGYAKICHHNINQPRQGGHNN